MFMWQLLDEKIFLSSANLIQIIRFFRTEGKALDASTSPIWTQSFKEFQYLDERKIKEEHEFLEKNYPKLTMHFM